MKVLILTDQFHTLNGAERLSVQLAEELNKRGIRADIASMYTPDMPGHREAMQRLRARGIQQFHFLGLQVHPAPLPFFRAVRKLRRILQEGNYDIVETYTVTPTIAASWAARGLRTRVVAGLHHVYERAHHNGLRHKVWRWSVRVNKSVRFYAISNFARQAWVEYSRTTPERTRTIYNAIADTFFDAHSDCAALLNELALPPDARLALYVGSVTQYKGIDTLLTALGPLFDKHKLHLLLVGSIEKPGGGPFPGEENFVPSLRDKIAHESWTSYVHFLGRRDDTPRIMASCDLLVHAARIEGFGLVLVEAMAAGLPVVASNAQGIPEVLEGTRAPMTSPEDVSAFRAAVESVLNWSDSDRADAAAIGRNRAESFRMSKRVDALVAYFEELLHESPPAR